VQDSQRLWKWRIKWNQFDPQHVREYEITHLLCMWSDQQALDSGPVILEQCAVGEARVSSEIACGLAVGEVL